MTDIAIRVENLSKLYRIGPRERYLALRDILARSVSAPFRALATILNGRRSSVVGQPSSVDGQPSSVVGQPKKRETGAILMRARCWR
jgi:hypothetical protein